MSAGSNKAASKSLAERLAKFAYDEPSVSPKRNPRRTMTVEAGPSTPARSPALAGKRSNTVTPKRELETEDDVVYTPVASRKRSKATKSPNGSGKKPRPFAGPEVYAHLKPVTDHLKADLDIVFCGINPGKMSSTLGHHFAHPTNKFWASKTLHRSGITDRQVSPTEDHLMPELFNFGLTNLCDRPTSEQSELSPLEMRLNVHHLTLKILANRPKVVCFVGKKIWDIYESVVSKSAGPARSATPLGASVRETQSDIKAEDDNQSLSEVKEDLTDDDISFSTVTPYVPPSIVKIEATDTKPAVSPRSKPPRSPAPPINISNPPRKPSIDWTQPRGFRLKHESGFTYFWVTPNTSGLERTPLAEQIIIFTHLKEYTESLKLGPPTGLYRDINIDGVSATVESIRAAAMAKGKL